MMHGGLLKKSRMFAALVVTHVAAHVIVFYNVELATFTVSQLQLRKHHADCPPESSDMLLYLAGVNEHAVLGIVGSKRWSLAHFLRTIHYFSNTGSRRKFGLAPARSNPQKGSSSFQMADKTFLFLSR